MYNAKGNITHPFDDSEKCDFFVQERYKGNKPPQGMQRHLNELLIMYTIIVLYIIYYNGRA